MKKIKQQKKIEYFLFNALQVYKNADVDVISEHEKPNKKSLQNLCRMSGAESALAMIVL